MKKPSSPKAGAPVPTILALHGFTGSGLDFQPLRAELKDIGLNWLCPDLPGHGSAVTDGPPVDCPLENVMDFIHQARIRAADPGNVILLGYSMGGRLALHYMVRHSVRNAILIGASPGLKNAQERRSRMESDKAWMDLLEGPNASMDAFCSAWEAQPIIQPQTILPEPLRGELAKRRRANSPKALAAALRNLGTGALPSLWDALPCLDGVHLLHGEFDHKFRKIHRRMRSMNPQFRIHSIPGCGHSPHLEDPRTTAKILASAISI